MGFIFNKAMCTYFSVSNDERIARSNCGLFIQSFSLTTFLRVKSLSTLCLSITNFRFDTTIRNLSYELRQLVNFTNLNTEFVNDDNNLFVKCHVAFGNIFVWEWCILLLEQSYWKWWILIIHISNWQTHTLFL